ncbi:leucine carboxyl methyltransferase 1 homolog [Selaginella moellendorffii]|uniref:leucine carboxyl methyltransferase 1 homolog n=1 Tax=Selaginella moellendorffii TaxID=88036 RepID=UPI000D1CFA00|nr:leucine carboxyl methyltransferase 1 homolog [Selaginella moellendorffii]|eukprot:XP_002979526.2 leucine carboxyl methyltransferase 1 homolog [Selaginella moellendorffii]
MAAPPRASSSRAAVQATNDDASASKLSCVRKGYMTDNYVQYFVRRPVKRSPLINRGYFARWAAIRALLMQFLSQPSSKRKQIVSLGAGFDTTFFQLKEEENAPDVFMEVDFLEVTSKKAMIVAACKETARHLDSPVFAPEKGEISSEHYKLFACDLTDTARLDAVCEKANLDLSLPTLILAECVLIYMDPEASRALLRWAASKFSNAVFVAYEQIHGEDAFGQQMIRNLESRGCPLLGIHDTSTLESKMNRFLETGWKRAVAVDMDEIYNRHIDPVERRRIERLEIFDEFEEWHIMQEHYCVAYGIIDENETFAGFGFSQISSES